MPPLAHMQVSPPTARLPSTAVQYAVFFLLFPGFFFYHTLIGLGIFGAFLGGYFSVVSLAALLPLMMLHCRRLLCERVGQDATELGLAAFLAYVLLVAGVNWLAGADPTTVRSHLLFVVDSINMFILFRRLDFSAAWVRTAALLALGGMSAIVFYYSVDGSFYLGALGLAKDPKSVATYQGFSRSYLVTYLVVVTRMRSCALRIALYALVAPALYVNTARTELVAMLCTIPLIELYFARYKVAVAVLFSAGLLAVKGTLNGMVAFLPDNRTLELLDLSQSSSAVLRHQLSVQAWQTIIHHPLLGAYASYEPGSYAHNLLSAWVDLGLFGFLCLLYIVLRPPLHMLASGYFNKPPQLGFVLPFCLSSVTVLMLATSHPFPDMLIGATLGAYARYQAHRRTRSDRAYDLGAPAQRHPYFYKTMPQHSESRV